LVDVVPSVDAVGQMARKHFTRLSSGLATWSRRLDLQPHRLRVLGTAGSGKTQLALQELRDAHARGRRAMYVCFNRPLADAMRAIAPVPESCTTFHELGARIARQRGAEIDYTTPGIFERIEQSFIEATGPTVDPVDLLVVDEGQDFEPEWATALLRLLKTDGRAFWLEDPSQSLYRRRPVELPRWAV